MARIAAIRAGEIEPPPGIRTLGLDGTHRWITHLEPGRVDLRWTVDPAYANLEGATICSWTVALADQALFFASQTLCLEGQQTRMDRLILSCVENIVEGEVTFRAVIVEHDERAMVGRCVVVDHSGVEKAIIDDEIAIVAA